MPLAAMLTYNELDGTEVAQVVQNRVEQFLKTVPHFQKHITLPRVRITVQTKLEIWADQPHPEVIPLNDRFDVVIHYEHEPVETITAESVDSSAPVAGGHPPDQIREMHGLPISQPARGPREIGGQVAIADIANTWQASPGALYQEPGLDGREVEGMPGLKINRTGSGMIDGMPTSTNATVAKIDQGPAGLRSGLMNRQAWHFGGGKK